MNEQTKFELERQLQAAGNAFHYPPTPDIAGAVARKLLARGRWQPRQRLAWAAALALVLLGVLLAVPPVRAQILEFIQIGVVRIFSPGITPTIPAATPSSDSGSTQPGSVLPGHPVPAWTAPPLPTLLPSILDLAGETNLAIAREKIPFPIRLPAYPQDLGPPDHVFLQDMEAPLVVLVWMHPEQPDQARLSLHLIGPQSMSVQKSGPEVVQETRVNGRLAFWTEGPYLLQLQNRQSNLLRLIEGHVLIWTEGEITYRLETDLPMEEAVRIAESLDG